MNYYGAFYRSALYPLLTRINAYLLRWLRKKHPRLRGRKRHKTHGQGPASKGHATSPTGPGS
jgi:RNA-directed DNA polymerase